MASLLTPEDVARRLGIHRRTLLGWLQNGTLPGIRVGKLWRIDPDALDAWLRERSTGEQHPREAS